MADTKGLGRFFDNVSNDRFGAWGLGGLHIADTAAHQMIFGCAFFGYLSLDLQALSGSTLAGTWLIEASNDYSDGGGGATTARAGTWTDVTACFRTPNATTGTAIPALTSGAHDALVCFTSGSGVVVPFPFAAVRITMTASSGAGNVQVAAHAQPIGG